MDQENRDPLDHLTDEQLAATIIDRISVLETKGIRLPEGWRGRSLSLRALDALLTTALRQLKAVP